MTCPNAKIHQEPMSQLQRSQDIQKGRKIDYNPKDIVHCKAFPNKSISQSYADKYCKSEKYIECKGYKDGVIPDFKNVDF